MGNMKKKKKWWVWLIVALYIYWIFSNSLTVAEMSASASYKVTSKLAQWIQNIGLFADFDTFHYYVRKLAHFTEFAGLGFLVVVAMHICPLFKSRFLNFASFLVLVPLADELIQRFVPGRSPQFTDVLIDGGGFLAGGFIAYLIVLIFKDIFLRNTKDA